VEAHGDAVPQFIAVLQAMKGNVWPEDAPAGVIGAMVQDGGFQFGLLDDDPLDWVHWNELPPL
jgi:hypothetical protein